MALQYLQGGRVGYPADLSFYLLSFIWRINDTAVYARGKVGLSRGFIFLSLIFYLEDKWHCSICKGKGGLSSRFIFLSWPPAKATEQIAENFCTSRCPIVFFVAMARRFIVLAC